MSSKEPPLAVGACEIFIPSVVSMTYGSLGSIQK